MNPNREEACLLSPCRNLTNNVLSGSIENVETTRRCTRALKPCWLHMKKPETRLPNPCPLTRER